MSDSYRVRITGDLDSLAPLLASNRYREHLGRDLDAVELGMFDHLEMVPGVVADVAVALARSNRIVACKYLHARVPSAALREVLLRLEALEERAARRLLTNQEEDEIRGALGRPLEEAELASFESLNAITPAIEGVVMSLVKRCLHLLAATYLQERLGNPKLSTAMVGVEHITNKYRRR